MRVLLRLQGALMIRHLFVVQYNISGCGGEHNSAPLDEEAWMTDDDFKFGFDVDDAEGKALAIAAANAVTAWLRHEDKDDEHRLPFRVAYRILSDEEYK